MKENEILVTINKPITEVFAFTTNPKNTPLWLPQIVEEVSDSYPPKIKTIYKNKSKDGKWSYYEVVEIEKNKIFTLMSGDKNYFVKYSYTKLGSKKTRLSYFEWVEKGELENPFTQTDLDRLKTIMER